MRLLMISIFLVMFLTALNGYELLTLVDTPTAGILQYGEVLITTKMYKDNGILMGSSVGIFPRFMFGISYGGENIVGSERPDWHEKVEVDAKYRIIDESPTAPAVVLGFDSRGHGVYHPELRRYDIKSKGFYAALSRNYLFFGNLGAHFGVNYSLENKDEDRSINFFAGIDKSLGDELIMMLDYDFALNDRNPKLDEETEKNSLFRRRGNGYLNLALYLRFTDFVAVKLAAYDLLQNNRHTEGADRAIMIDYNMKF